MKKAAAGLIAEIARTWVPIIPAIFRLENDFVQPRVRGFSAPVFKTY